MAFIETILYIFLLVPLRLSSYSLSFRLKHFRKIILDAGELSAVSERKHSHLAEADTLEGGKKRLELTLLSRGIFWISARRGDR